MPNEQHSSEKNNRISNDNDEIDLLELFYRLMEKVWLLVACGVLGALIMVIYSFAYAKPVYKATSKLYVLSSSDSVVNLSDLQIGSYLTSDYADVFKTWEVHQQVIDNLQLSYSRQEIEKMVSVSNPNNTRILYITVSSRIAEEAMKIANEYASVAKRFISEIMQTDEPQIMSAAQYPEHPVSPQKAKNTVIGFVVGFFICAAVILIEYFFDDKVKTADDIMKYTGMPTLSVVPTESGTKKPGTDVKQGGKQHE